MKIFNHRSTFITLLLATSITICQEPVVFLKNNADHAIRVDLIVDPALNIKEKAVEIEANSSWKLERTDIPANKITGMIIQYCASDKCPLHGSYDTTYEVAFKSSKAKKYYLKFSLDDNIPLLEPQAGILFGTRTSGGDASYSLANNIEKSGIEIIRGRPEGALEIKKKSTMTQSEAHMSIPAIRQAVEDIYKLNRNEYYKELYNNVVKREKQHKDSYAFYNAFSNEWRIPQDLYLELHKRLHNDAGVNIKNFRAFRWLPVTHITPKEFLKSELKNFGMVNDNEWRVKAYLLSTNLALFGNVGFPGECTFDYYINAKSHAIVDDAIFKSILDIFDDPKKYPTGKEPKLYKYIPQIARLAELLEVQPLPNGKEPQTLSQIFIPKKIVDQIAYVSWVQGVPYDEKMVNWVLAEAQKRFGKMPAFTASGPVLDDVRQVFKDEQGKHPLFGKILESIEQCKYCMAYMLNEYMAYPELVPGLNNLQARLILSPQYVGNPASGVIMYEYDRIKSYSKREYDQALKEIVDSIVADIKGTAKSGGKKIGRVATAEGA